MLDVVLDGVFGDKTSSLGVCACNSQAGIDVKGAGDTALAEDQSLLLDCIPEVVISSVWPFERGLGRELLGVTGKVVDGLLDGGDASIERVVAAVLGLVDGVGPSLRDAELKVENAVLVGVGNLAVAADGSNVLVEDQSDSLLVIAESTLDRAGGATRS